MAWPHRTPIFRRRRRPFQKAAARAPVGPLDSGGNGVELLNPLRKEEVFGKSAFVGRPLLLSSGRSNTTKKRGAHTLKSMPPDLGRPRSHEMCLSPGITRRIAVGVAAPGAKGRVRHKPFTHCSAGECGERSGRSRHHQTGRATAGGQHAFWPARLPEDFGFSSLFRFFHRFEIKE